MSSSSPPSQTPQSFHKFPLLHPEIRLRIFSLLTTTRLVRLNAYPTALFTIPTTPPTYTFDTYLASKLPPPILASINRESRSNALSPSLHYTQAFRCLDDADDPVKATEKYTYVNFDRDVLLIDDYSLQYIPPSDNALIRNIIIRTTAERYHSFAYGNAFIGPDSLLKMERLREITVVSESDYPMRSQPRSVYEQLLVEEFEKAREGKRWEGTVRFIGQGNCKEDTEVGERTLEVWDEFVKIIEREEQRMRGEI